MGQCCSFRIKNEYLNRYGRNGSSEEHAETAELAMSPLCSIPLLTNTVLTHLEELEKDGKISEAKKQQIEVDNIIIMVF